MRGYGKITRVLTDAEKATLRRMMATGVGRDELARALDFHSNNMPQLMRQNGMGNEYAVAMARNRGAAGEAPGYVWDASEEASRQASEALADRIMQSGARPDPECRPYRTFEERLQLLREGKARLVPNIKISRPATLVGSATGEAAC